jgi:hypothetical protein
MCSTTLPSVAELAGLDARQLERTLRDLDAVRRRVEAAIAETVGVAERSAAYAEDGHASVSGWVKATCNYSSGETKAVVQAEFTCRLRWTPGTLAIWDNRCLLHLAINDYDGSRRLLHRTTTTGEPPVGPRVDGSQH